MSQNELDPQHALETVRPKPPVCVRIGPDAQFEAYEDMYSHALFVLVVVAGGVYEVPVQGSA